MRKLSHGLVAPTQRTIPDFDLRRPLSVDEAVTAGAVQGAVYAQGCTDLFAQFREDLTCTTLVSLDRIDSLRQISYDGGTLSIGAGAIHHEGARHPAVLQALPGLAGAWRRIATHRIRQRATIGGNIMARRPRYEMSIMCDSLGAELSFIGGSGEPSPLASTAPNGRWRLSVDDIWERRVPPGALLLSVDIPDVPGAWFGYERSLRPLLTVAATVRVSASGGETVRVSVGSEMRPHFTVEAPLEAGPMDITAALPDAIGDAVAGAKYRRHAAGVLLGRLLAKRASEEESR